ncbi:hypothetical protein P879_05714 [Paragonimus westermani]|uniref:Uncharacterized protein n=1 Tax=Paragonimus westermani TaxID=34504 RepID=A0A8T0D212_9TREM|nr:hypothetical protein P879_05714 [Paragonimus westermani]
MEQQFNYSPGATSRAFSLGQLVLAKDSRDGIEKWATGRILRWTGRVIYDVEAQSSIWVSCANQLHPFFSTGKRPIQLSHSVGYFPGYIRATSRRFIY